MRNVMSPRSLPRRREQGIALALVLILIVLMITAVYTFSRRAIINVTIAQNRSQAAAADAVARSGLRLAEVMLYWSRLQDQADAADDRAAPDLTDLVGASGALGGQDLWARIQDFPIELASGARLQLSVEELGGKLNLNALIKPTAPRSEDPDDRDTNDEGTSGGPSPSEIDEAVEYLVLVLRHIIEGIDAAPEDKNYDERAIAENLIDYIDPDDRAISGRSENDYYQRQEPPYRPRNGPFLTFQEIGLVEGVDPALLKALRPYVTIHPIGAQRGIDLNRAEPWVLPLVYSGPSGDRELISERDVRRILGLRKKKKLICTDVSADPDRCVSLSEAGLDEGSVYPELKLPLPISVFRVVSEAQVGALRRRFEAIIDTRPTSGPQMLSFRRLRGAE